MKIVHAASELFPYVKTGGLADAVASLGVAQADRGHEVVVFVPGYRSVVDHPDAAEAETLLRPKIEMGDVYMSGEVRMFSPRDGVTVYMICRDEFFDRRNPYGTSERDYEDNHHRFIFFCKGVVETMRLLRMNVDVLHCHDWQTGLLPLLLRHAEQRHGDVLAMRTVFTIHNIAFQGVFPMRSFYRTNLPDELMGIDGVEFYGQMNMLKGGILFADRVTTVSPRYAQEIQTPEFGCGLEGVVATRADDIVGLLNGIDSSVWNPATDALLPATYRLDKLAGKWTCREELLRRHGFNPDYDGPIFGMVCRLTTQKGVDLVLANREFFKRENCRLIVLGKGDPALEKGLKELAAAMPKRVALSTKLDEGMSHLVTAGSDFFLMPSRFEPCGLSQMYSQTYGTVPIVTRVGGLADTVVDIDQDPKHGTGIQVPVTSDGLLSGMERALRLHRNVKKLVEVQLRGMRQDFSWTRTVEAYERLYEDGE
ncbi:MAG: glycogen synthase GlgA [Opitutaceae bacterium]|jgi:starch synthase|nr:glycogen synthase GlgA [Opitutaceae bacterium]